MKDKLKRLEALSAELNSLSDQLTRAIKIVEGYLVVAGVHVTDRYSTDYGDWYYGKLDGKWCFYLQNGLDQKRVFNVTRDQKIDFFRVLPFLLDLLENRLYEQIDRMQVDKELLSFLEGYREKSRAASKPGVV